MINSKESDALQWLKYYSALERVSGLALCVWCTFSSFMSPSSCTMSSLLLSWRDDILCSSSSFLCLKHTNTDLSQTQRFLTGWWLLEPNPKVKPYYRFKTQNFFYIVRSAANCLLKLLFDISGIHLTICFQKCKPQNLQKKNTFTQFRQVKLI